MAVSELTKFVVDASLFISLLVVMMWIAKLCSPTEETDDETHTETARDVDSNIDG
jgi:hypothetical protein|tara:strand:- start:224 stop:388 length:165 start_codon:yes stop_codon:yes gene_type:complete